MLANCIVLAFGLQPRSELDSVHLVDELRRWWRKATRPCLTIWSGRCSQRSFQFGELTAADIMVPRTDVEALDVNLSQEELRDRIVRLNHSASAGVRQNAGQHRWRGARAADGAVLHVGRHDRLALPSRSSRSSCRRACTWTTC